MNNVDKRLVLEYIKNHKNEHRDPFYLNIVGNSMLPTIRQGDRLPIYTDKENYKVGDIICYLNIDHLVLHRIVGMVNKNGEIYYKLKGDNLSRRDVHLVDGKHILGYYNEKKNAFFEIKYPKNNYVDIVTDLLEVQSYLYHIVPQNLLHSGFTNNKDVRSTIAISFSNGYYKMEAFTKLFRRTFKYKLLEELKGQLYSVLFHAEAINDVFVDYIAFHAGGVLIDNKAALIIGRSGQGKSTLLYYLAKKGYSYLGDERVYMRYYQKRLEIIPFYSPLMIRHDIAINEDNKEKVLLSKEKCLEEKYAIRVKKVSLSSINYAQGIFILPKWKRETKVTQIRCLSKQEAFSILVENLSVKSDLTTEKIKMILHIIAEFGVYEISYRDIDSCIDNIVRLLLNDKIVHCSLRI